VQGGSKGEIYKAADAMGRLVMVNGKLLLRFSPSDAAFGKNPGQLPVLDVPHFDQPGLRRLPRPRHPADQGPAQRAERGPEGRAEEQKWFRDTLPSIAVVDEINGLMERAKAGGTACKALLNKRADRTRASPSTRRPSAYVAAKVKEPRRKPPDGDAARLGHRHRPASLLLREDDMELAELIARLKHLMPSSEAMEAGTALHKALELAEPASSKGFEADGFTFSFETDAEIDLPPSARSRRPATTSSTTCVVTLVGKVDAIHGKRIDDHKFTAKFDPDRYLDSYQWRLYLEVFDADDVPLEHLRGRRVGAEELPHPQRPQAHHAPLSRHGRGRRARAARVRALRPRPLPERFIPEAEAA
jgi:hypothetical protein